MTIEEIIRNIIREELSSYKTTPQPEAMPTTMPPTPGPAVMAPTTAIPAPPVAAPPVAAPPVAAPPVAAPQAPQVAPVPTLDEIRAMGNDFARAHPDKQHLFVAFMQSKGVNSLADMPPAEYPACKAELLRLSAGGA